MAFWPGTKIYAVLIKEIDDISFESLERGLGNLLDMLWSTVEARKGFHIKPELCGNHYFIAERSKCALRSATGHLLQLFRVPIPLHLDL